MASKAKAALLAECAGIAGALAAPARLAILEVLAQGERGVDELARRAGLSVANCSQHLQLLARAGLVEARREGRFMRYRLADERVVAAMALLRELAEARLVEVGRILASLTGGSAPPKPVGREALARKLAQGTVTLIDVRPSDEYAAGHIPGAINLPPGEIEAALEVLDPATEIVAYCRGPFCVLAEEAAAELRRRGFRARTMHGGLPDWRAEGRAVIEAQGQDG